MELKVSKKNGKIGEVPNLSLTPGTSCVPDIPCFTEGCYANAAYKRWPNVKNAWDSNLELYKRDPDQFFEDLKSWLRENKTKRFRMFVGGDFPDLDYFTRFNIIARHFMGVQFLTFTKRYEYNFVYAPNNSKIILSTWPGYPLPKDESVPWAWLEEDDRKPENYIRCVGNCSDCGHLCWSAVSVDLHVVFPKHK